VPKPLVSQFEGAGIVLHRSLLRPEAQRNSHAAAWSLSAPDKYNVSVGVAFAATRGINIKHKQAMKTVTSRPTRIFKIFRNWRP